VPAEPVLALRGLKKSFGALRVTDDVSLDLLPGECHALIGPNGAGKTTLLHIVSGQLMPDGGTILFAGRDVTRLPAHARARIGLARTYQITSVVPSFTALDNVALAVQARAGNARLFRRAAGDERLEAPARAALKAVGLEARAGVAAGLLSHGEKRALELAMALAQEPVALLLDEPMAGMGREESVALTRTLSRLKSRYAMLLVEHDMEAVFALADRVSVLTYGRVLATDAPDAVRADPAVREAYLGEDAA
jgi:branched-chain amino acid transport system ATP-binding protein